MWIEVVARVLKFHLDRCVAWGAQMAGGCEYQIVANEADRQGGQELKKSQIFRVKVLQLTRALAFLEIK